MTDQEKADRRARKLYERGAELAESWLNGNRQHVIDTVIATTKGGRALAALVTLHLGTAEATTFVDRLVRETVRI